MSDDMQDSTQIAEVFKGLANHYRVDMLRLLAKQPDLTVDAAADLLNANYKTIAVHMGRMHRSGLITKKYKGTYVQHRLTQRGKVILKFLRILERE